MAQVRLDDSTLVNIANKIREKNKETDTYKPSEMPDAIDRILVTEPIVEQLDITENGTYTVPKGVHGYNPINVDVQPELEELTATDNGEYTPSAYGYSKVTVDVQPELEDIEITANGTYTSDKYGYGEVIVNTPPAPTAEMLAFSGDLKELFTKDRFTKLIEAYGDLITTNNITQCSNMFSECKTLTKIPFDLNFDPNSTVSCLSLFGNCLLIKELPKMNNLKISQFNSMFSNCYNLRTIPSDIDDTWDYSPLSASTSSNSGLFNGCFSLRSFPMSLLENAPTTLKGYYYSIYSSLFSGCKVLDKIENLPVTYLTVTMTTNMFSSMCSGCSRLSKFTFALDPETNAPYVITGAWSNQVLDFSNSGYFPNDTEAKMYINEKYNSGITADKLVTDDASYQALKDDPDWYTISSDYSRYNKSSAIETMRSLPDVSSGTGNKIRFKGYAGFSIPGECIRDLTDEEKAIAADKGWTVEIQ